MPQEVEEEEELRVQGSLCLADLVEVEAPLVFPERRQL